MYKRFTVFLMALIFALPVPQRTNAFGPLGGISGAIYEDYDIDLGTTGTCKVFMYFQDTTGWAYIGLGGKAPGGAYWLNDSIDTSLPPVTQSQIEACGFTNVSGFMQTGVTGPSYADDDYIGFSFTGTPTAGVPTNYEFAFSGETFTTASAGASSPANQAPTASAGTDQPSVASAATVTLSGGGTDSDGTIASYKWSRNGGSGGAVTLSPSDTAQSPGFTAPTLTPTDTALTFIFDLVVTDNLGLTSSADSVTITVLPPANQAPTASAGADQPSVASAATVTLSGGGTDPDGTIASYKWSRNGGSGGAVTLSPSDTAQSPGFTAPTLTPTDTALTFIFDLVVTDNLGLASSADSVTITVLPPANQAPTASAGADQPSVASASSVTLSGGGTDSDGTIASYKWSRNGGSGGAVTLSPSDTAQSPGFTAPTLTPTDTALTFIFDLVVTDNLGLASSTDSVTITVLPPLDTTRPDVSISGAPSKFSGVESFDVSIVFTEDVFSFASGDIVATNAFVTVLNGSGDTYVATIMTTGLGDASISVPENSATDAAGNGNTASNAVSVNGTIVAETQRRISGFQFSRANHLTNGQTSLTGLLTGGSAGVFDADVSRNVGTLQFSTRQDASVWVALDGSWSNDGTANSNYFLGMIGGTFYRSPNLVVGALLEFDQITQDANAARVEGTGWLGGPFIVTRLPQHPLYLEGRVLFGRSDNTLSGTGTPSASFETKRYLVQGRIEGKVSYGKATIWPNLSASHTEDEQLAFTDGFGNNIPRQVISLSEISLGTDFSAPLPSDDGTLELFGGFSVIWSDVSGTGVASTFIPTFEESRARVKLGFNYVATENSKISVSGFYDGIGTNGYDSHGVSLRFSTRF